MGIKSFLRRWLGIEPAQKTVKTTVARAYQQPLMVRRPYEVVATMPKQRINTSRPRTIEGFYAKVGGTKSMLELERFGDYDYILRIKSELYYGKQQYRLQCRQIHARSPVAIIFDTLNEAESFKRKLINYHERMKAKAAKGGLNFN